MHIVLVEPEIPGNTGNIARLCAASGTSLHLIRPLGFSLEDKYLKRAGLDYWHLLDIHVWDNLEAFLAAYPNNPKFLLTTKTTQSYVEKQYPKDAVLMFGKETAGLPEELRKRYADGCVRIPMRAEARSLNLANSVAIVLYEALRQNGFHEGATI